MLNRKLAPRSAEIPIPYLTNFTKDAVCDNFDIFSLQHKEHPIVKFKIVCNVGLWCNKKHGISILAAKMIQGGTNTKDSSQIAQKLDYYGAYLAISTDSDFTYITVTVLKKFYKNVLEIILDTIKNSTVPSPYLALQKSILKDKMALERRNYSYLALEHLCQHIYGKEHPYGKILYAKNIDEIKIDDVKEYYKNNIFSGVRVFIYGDFEPSDVIMFKDLKKQIASSSSPNNAVGYKDLKDIPGTDVKWKQHIDTNLDLTLHIQDNMQDTIVFGTLLPKKNHEDFMGLVVLNELIGGYFGSRLMTNIREKLGYTYGIYSKIHAMQESSLFYVASDVSLGYADEVYNKCIEEIYKIASTPIGDVELNMLKNYMKGKLLMSMNDPFAKMNNLIKVYNFGLNKSYYENLHKTIDKITAKDITGFAQKYFTPTKFPHVFVTKKKLYTDNL